MKRDLNKLSHKEFDVLIVGGGIYGAAAAWDAALRGLSVALVERGDFGQATSANSLKIVHGGLRYLQKLDWKRMRESIRERRALLRIAPHHVRPMTFLIPSQGLGKRSRAALAAASLLNDFISRDRNQGISDPNRRIPKSRTVSLADYKRFAETLCVPQATGGFLWHDAFAYNPERLVLNFVQSAAEQGAVAANHVQVTALTKQGKRVSGAEAVDGLSGRAFKIRARSVLNTAGPWFEQISNDAGARVPAWAKAVNLVVRPIPGRISVGAPTPDGRRFFFAVPWREHTLIGTAYFPYQGDPANAQATSAEIDAFLNDFNQAVPQAALKREDIRFVHWGVLPAADSSAEPKLLDQYRITDPKTGGPDGLVSVCGVKLTTARDVAEKAVDRIIEILGRPFRPCRSDSTPLVGGQIENFDKLLSGAVMESPAGVSPKVLQHLLRHYGTEYPRVLNRVEAAPALGRLVSGSTECIRAEVVHAAREEMALTLSDVVFRRTGLATTGHPGESCLQDCAFLLAEELGWTREQMNRQLEQTRAELARILQGVTGPAKTEARHV